VGIIALTIPNHVVLKLLGEEFGKVWRSRLEKACLMGDFGGSSKEQITTRKIE
jgi:hypothetical protein